jgi:hypothetical protein
VKDDVRIRDLVSSFIIPEIDRKKEEDRSKYNIILILTIHIS